MCSFNIFVSSVTVVADYLLKIRRVALDGIMTIDLNTQVFKTLDKEVDGGLIHILRYDHSTHEKTCIVKGVYHSEGIHIIRDTKVSSDLILLDRNRRNDYDDLGIVLHLK